MDIKIISEVNKMIEAMVFLIVLTLVALFYIGNLYLIIEFEDKKTKILGGILMFVFLFCLPLLPRFYDILLSFYGWLL